MVKNMKKLSKIHTLITAALMMSAVLAHAKQEESRMQQVGQIAQTGKKYAENQFNEMVYRFRR